MKLALALCEYSIRVEDVRDHIITSQVHPTLEDLTTSLTANRAASLNHIDWAWESSWKIKKCNLYYTHGEVGVATRPCGCGAHRGYWQEWAPWPVPQARRPLGLACQIYTRRFCWSRILAAIFLLRLITVKVFDRRSTMARRSVVQSSTDMNKW